MPLCVTHPLLEKDGYVLGYQDSIDNSDGGDVYTFTKYRATNKRSFPHIDDHFSKSASYTETDMNRAGVSGRANLIIQQCDAHKY